MSRLISLAKQNGCWIFLVRVVVYSSLCLYPTFFYLTSLWKPTSRPLLGEWHTVASRMSDDLVNTKVYFLLVNAWWISWCALWEMISSYHRCTRQLTFRQRFLCWLIEISYGLSGSWKVKNHSEVDAVSQTRYQSLSEVCHQVSSLGGKRYMASGLNLAYIKREQRGS